VIIFDKFAGMKEGNESKVMDDIISIFPWWTKESVKNFWKMMKKKDGQTLDDCFETTYKESPYCFNYQQKALPHQKPANKGVVERFVKKIDTKKEESKDEIKSDVDEPAEVVGEIQTEKSNLSNQDTEMRDILEVLEQGEEENKNNNIKFSKLYLAL